MKTIVPGSVTLADWRTIYHGSKPGLDPACLERVKKSAALVAKIASEEKAVYGVNTGFGLLATIRIAPDDLAKLQHNIVISHAAGLGEAMPRPIVRLMMALKLASLGRGASGIRVETLRFLEKMLMLDLLPVVPAQGSVGASGDLAPLAHMSAAMIGLGEIDDGNGPRPAIDVLSAHDMIPISLGPKEGLALLNGTQFSTA